MEHLHDLPGEPFFVLGVAFVAALFLAWLLTRKR